MADRPAGRPPAGPDENSETEFCLQDRMDQNTFPENQKAPRALHPESRSGAQEKTGGAARRSSPRSRSAPSLRKRESRAAGRFPGSASLPVPPSSRRQPVTRPAAQSKTRCVRPYAEQNRPYSSGGCGGLGPPSLLAPVGGTRKPCCYFFARAGLRILRTDRSESRRAYLWTSINPRGNSVNRSGSRDV